MQAWWTYSPYWDTIIYLGGSNRACPQPNLTSSWVNAVHNQGWSFYLTWVGPQSQCPTPARVWNTYIDNNTSAARQQGVNEASAARNVAFNLGLNGRNIYYYNMENYNETNVACRNAVNAFVDGWTNFYQLTADKAGVYASGCDASYWPYIAHVPDDVWIADWNNDPDVWGLNCLPNGWWAYSQRLHQYWGDVSETYGGVRLLIDRDCANGLVTPHGHGSNDPTCTVE
jgi:hypothetical protein